MDRAAADVYDPIYFYGDGIGHVRLLDVMGDEFTPAEDARTSTGKGRLGPEKDAALQARMANDGHTSPFEGVVLKFEMVVPLSVLREIDRHRTLDKPADGELGPELMTPEEAGRKWFSRNEMSGRYVQFPPDYFFPADVRRQSATNRQGTADSPLVDEGIAREFLERGRRLTAEARGLYDWAVESGIEKGQARFFNTQNQYTKIRLVGSLKNWLDFLFLRLPDVVLRECQVIARAVESILSRLFPTVIAQWRESVRYSVRLTRTEADTLRVFLEQGTGDTRILESVARKIRG